MRGARRTVTADRCGVGSLFDLDPDLGDALSEEQKRVVRRHVRVELRCLARGHWHPADDPVSKDAHYGLLVVHGVLSRRAQVGKRRSVELLGGGDLLCPDVADSDPYAQVPQIADWMVHAPVQLALIDDDLAAGLAGLPGVLGELQRRSIVRSRELVLRLALASEPVLEVRLEYLLWHLADRWGVRRGGIVERDLPLTRELIAELAGASRSSTSGGLAKLERRGIVERRNGGPFVLLGSPPELPGAPGVH